MEDAPVTTTGWKMRRAGVVGAIALIAAMLYVGMASAQPGQTTVPGHDCTTPAANSKRPPANINLLPRLGEAQLVAHYQVDMTKAPKATVPPQRATPHAGQPGEPPNPVLANSRDSHRIKTSVTTNPCAPPGDAALPRSAP